MEKKLIVMLFPVKDFVLPQEESLQEIVNENIKISDIFDTIIQERYINNGYEFAIATYPDREIYGINIEPSKVANCNSNYDDFYKRNLESIMMDYLLMVNRLNSNDYSEIVVGGYHIGDCVDKFSQAIENSSSAKVIIDGELSNMFMKFGLLNQDGTLNQNYEFYNSIVKKLNIRQTVDNQLNEFHR